MPAVELRRLAVGGGQRPREVLHGVEVVEDLHPFGEGLRQEGPVVEGAIGHLHQGRRSGRFSGWRSAHSSAIASGSAFPRSGIRANRRVARRSPPASYSVRVPQPTSRKPAGPLGRTPLRAGRRPLGGSATVLIGTMTPSREMPTPPPRPGSPRRRPAPARGEDGASPSPSLTTLAGQGAAGNGVHPADGRASPPPARRRCPRGSRPP